MTLALGLAIFFESQATTTVIVVGPADTEEGLGGDLGLSGSGRMRAVELSRVLGDADVIQGLDAILVSPGRIFGETAEPLAQRLKLPVQVVDTTDPEALSRLILTDHKGKIVLVIGEPETIPAFIPEFHGSKKVPELRKREYDNLYIVTIPWYGKVKTLRLHYGVRYAPAASAQAMIETSP